MSRTIHSTFSRNSRNVAIMCIGIENYRNAYPIDLNDRVRLFFHSKRFFCPIRSWPKDIGVVRFGWRLITCSVQKHKTIFTIWNSRSVWYGNDPFTFVHELFMFENDEMLNMVEPSFRISREHRWLYQLLGHSFVTETDRHVIRLNYHEKQLLSGKSISFILIEAKKCKSRKLKWFQRLHIWIQVC
jgi:hypothetical protein